VLFRKEKCLPETKPTNLALDRSELVGCGVTGLMTNSAWFSVLLVAGCQHDKVGGQRFAAAHPRSFCDELGDTGKLLLRLLCQKDVARQRERDRARDEVAVLERTFVIECVRAWRCWRRRSDTRYLKASGGLASTGG
jgi:hypothetical protein